MCVCHGCLSCEHVRFIGMNLMCDDQDETVKNAICQKKSDPNNIRYNIQLKSQIIKYFYNRSYMVNDRLNVLEDDLEPETNYKFMNQMDRLWEDITYFNSNFLDMEGFIVKIENDIIVFDIMNHLDPEHMMCAQILVNWEPRSVEHEIHNNLVENSFITENSKLLQDEVMKKMLDGFKYY